MMWSGTVMLKVYFDLLPPCAREGPAPCPQICNPPACACREGFYRNATGQCVNAASCPSRCGENEVLNQCGNRCEGKCENVGRGPVPCPLICDPPACACRDGFYRNAQGRCVSASNCPQTCGPNESLNQCGNRCEGKCENVGRSTFFTEPTKSQNLAQEMEEV
ncbi:trypsin Inhibitor like cysteine rich domain protein [Cooperia oncophora]